MIYRLAADLIVAIHLSFVIFVVFGGLLVLWRRVVLWLHVPAAVYAAAIELIGWTCPLTPVEKHLRRLAGSSGYEGGFLQHYAEPILYPADWQAIKGYLAAGVIIINLAVYGVVIRRLLRGRRLGDDEAADEL